ncbi:MAG TPA: acyl-CoA dehydrogenase, partial [Alphaproteobacteria bacterium]|nr:acyl-CoA dehydrogenase [Alphaproteobacteria bacterium]
MSEPTEAEIREEVRAWIADNWDPDRGLVEWRNMLVDSGWGVPSWPKQWYGRELNEVLSAAVEREFKRAGAIGVARTGVRMLVAATL